MGGEKRGVMGDLWAFYPFLGNKMANEANVQSYFSLSEIGREQTCMWKGRGPFCSVSQRDTWQQTRSDGSVSIFLYVNPPLFYFVTNNNAVTLVFYLSAFAVNGSYLNSGSLPFVSPTGLGGCS